MLENTPKLLVSARWAVRSPLSVPSKPRSSKRGDAKARGQNRSCHGRSPSLQCSVDLSFRSLRAHAGSIGSLQFTSGYLSRRNGPKPECDLHASLALDSLESHETLILAPEPWATSLEFKDHVLRPIFLHGFCKACLGRKTHSHTMLEWFMPVLQDEELLASYVPT